MRRRRLILELPVAAQTGFSLVALANMRGRQRDFDRVARDNP